MKSFSFLILFFVCALEASAQQPWGASFTINNQTYKCVDLGTTLVYNQQNLSHNRLPESHPKEYCNMARLEYTLVRNVLHTVFSTTQRGEFKANDTGLGITFYIKPVTGQIDEVSFSVDKNTPITQQQIYQLEQGLKGLIMPKKPLCGPMTWIVFPLTVYWE